MHAAPVPVEPRSWLDPAWKDWLSIGCLALFALVLPYGCGPQSSPSGLQKHLVGRWEKEGEPAKTLIFTEQGELIYPDGRSEELARDIDGWKTDFSGGKYDVTVKKDGRVIGHFSVKVRSEDQMQITAGDGLDSTDLRGTYARVAGTGSASAKPGDPPADDDTLASKLAPLKRSLAELEQKQETIFKTLMKLEKQRVDLLPRMREEGITAETPVANLSEKGKIIRSDMLDVLKQMKLVKAKHDDLKNTVERTKSLIAQVERRVDLEKLDVDPKSVSDLHEAQVLMADLKDRMKEEKGSTLADELEAQKILNEQLSPTKKD